MIENLINDLAHSLGSWAYLLIALMATAETAAFVGFIAPGEFTIILGGVLAGEGTLSIQLLIGIVWVSIVIGDSIGFLIGRRFGRSFLIKHGPRVRLHEERIQQVESYFHRHGGKTIFFGRWVGFVRPLMPFTAGTSGMPYRRFLPYDVLSAGLFGSTFCLLGYVFWRNFSTLTSIAGKGALGLGIVAAIVVVGYLAFKRLRDRERRERIAARLHELGQRPLLRPVAAALSWLWRLGLRPLWRWAIVPIAHVLRPPLRFLGQRLTPGELGIEFTTLLATAAVGGYVFGAYADVVTPAGHGVVTTGDRTALDWAHDIQDGTLTTVAKAITWLGNLWVVAGAVGVAVVLLFRARHQLEAAALAAGLLVTHFGVQIAKAAVDRPRPPDALVHPSGSSFPSGHAANSIAWVALAVVLARAFVHVSSRGAVVLVGIALAALIGLSRLYLRVHYLSDVTSGWAVGLTAYAICGGVALVISHLRNNERSRRAVTVEPARAPSDG